MQILLHIFKFLVASSLDYGGYCQQCPKSVKAKKKMCLKQSLKSPKLCFKTQLHMHFELFNFL